MISKAQALCSLYPNVKWVLRDDTLEWNDTDVPEPTEEQINQEIARLQVEYDNKQYQRDRVKEYPPLPEQLDMQYWDAVNNTTVWQDTINAIKAKYPKPQS